MLPAFSSCGALSGVLRVDVVYFFEREGAFIYIAAFCSTRIGSESLGLAAMPSFESLLIPLVQMNAPKARFLIYTFAKAYDGRNPRVQKTIVPPAGGFIIPLSTGILPSTLPYPRKACMLHS